MFCDATSAIHRHRFIRLGESFSCFAVIAMKRKHKLPRAKSVKYYDCVSLNRFRPRSSMTQLSHSYLASRRLVYAICAVDSFQINGCHIMPEPIFFQFRLIKIAKTNMKQCVKMIVFNHGCVPSHEFAVSVSNSLHSQISNAGIELN